MTPLVNIFTVFTSIGVVIMNIAVLFLLYTLIVSKGGKDKEGNAILMWISNHAYILIIAIILLSVAGSYFYSIVAGFAPCELCWAQRIVFYSLIILFGIGLIQSKRYGYMPRDIFVGATVFSGFALIISTFQYYGSMFNPNVLAACEAIGVSCSKNYFISFGYINIPLMALSSFALIFVIALIRLVMSLKNQNV